MLIDEYAMRSVNFSPSSPQEECQLRCSPGTSVLAVLPFHILGAEGLSSPTAKHLARGSLISNATARTRYF